MALPPPPPDPPLFLSLGTPWCRKVVVGPQRLENKSQNGRPICFLAVYSTRCQLPLWLRHFLQIALPGQGCHPHSEGMPGAYHNLAPMSPSRQSSIKTRLGLARIHFKWKSLFLSISLALCLSASLSASPVPCLCLHLILLVLNCSMRCKNLKVFKMGSQPAPRTLN